MNLIIDIGNTKIKMAIFDGNIMVDVEISDTIGLEQLERVFKEYDPSNVILCSVRQIDRIVEDWISNHAFYIRLSEKTKLPIINKYQSPNSLGFDRLASVVGANKLYAGRNILCVDIGTCITYDFISGEGIYYGGSITPGVDLRFKAMNSFTEKLPLVNLYDVKNNVALIGSTTEKSIQSGVMNGIASEIDGMIDRYQEKNTELISILTGGHSTLFDSYMKSKIFALPNLVLQGLNTILKYNAT